MSPDSPVIVFDGVCVLCNGSVAFVLRHDRRGLYRFAANQTASGAALLAKHGIDPADPVSMLLCEGDRAWTHSDAVLRIAASFGGAWRLLGLLRVVPRGLRDAAYRFVARRRYRWFGRHEACLMPTPETRARFLLD